MKRAYGATIAIAAGVALDASMTSPATAAKQSPDAPVQAVASAGLKSAGQTMHPHHR